MGRDPVRRGPRRPEGVRLPDALRRGLGHLRRVRFLRHRPPRLGRRGPRPRRRLLSLMRRAAVCVGVVAVLVTGACGGAGGSGGTHVAKIGVIAPLDAGLTQFGRGIRNSVQAAVDEADGRNAIPGWKLEVDAADDSSNPSKGETAARRLAADVRVIGVVGTYNSGVAARVAPVLTRAGIVMISPANTDPVLTRGSDPARPVRPHSNFFRLVAADDVQAPFLAKAAFEDVRARRVAVVS